MAWTDACRFELRANAEVLLSRKGNRKGITGIIKGLYKQSGIPFKTLERWYYEKDSSLKNEGKKSKPQQKQADVKSLTDAGGAREGAGRPQKNGFLKITDAMRFVELAISQLRKIKKDDPEKQSALNHLGAALL